MHHAYRVPRPILWGLLLALGISSMITSPAQAQQPVASEVMVPVGTTGTIPTTVGAMTTKIEVIPPIVQAQLSFDAKNIEISGLAPGFAQVRLLDAANNVLQVINVQVVPPDMDIPFGDTKVFQASPGTKIQDVRVTDPDIVRTAISMDRTAVEVTGTKLGATKLTIIDDKGGFQVFNIVVVVSEKYLAFKIRQAVPTANVHPVQIAKNNFVLNGTVEKVEDISAVIGAAGLIPGITIVNALRVGGVQTVQLDVVIASVSRNELRNMGFSWFYNDGSTVVGSLLTNPSAATFAGAIGEGVADAFGQASSNVVFGVAGGEFFGFLQALRNEGLAKFLACPKLVTMSGKMATFLSGGRLAIPEPSGLGTVAVRFEDFGTELNFLPIVLGNGKIFLEVNPVVNNVNAALGTVIQGTAVPGFDTQRLFASVELEAGQTFAIGGLIQTQVNATTTKVPVLGDVPFLGAAFRNVTHNHTETELLILVTPHLVDAMACNQLPKYVPGQETRIPDDFELFLEGILEAPRGQRHVFHGKKYQAPYLNSPSANVYPCGAGGYGYGGTCGVNGQCETGTCAPVNGTAAPAPVAIPTKTQRALPVNHFEESGLAYPTGGMDFTLPATSGSSVPVGIYEQEPLIPGYTSPTTATFGPVDGEE